VRGVSQERLDLLDNAVTELANICVDEGWELAPRNLKNAVKFQTGGGRNVFMVAIRKRGDHRIRFCLGPDFDPSSVQVLDTIKTAMKHNPTSRWWGLPLRTASINEYRPLLSAAYSYVTGAA
jgi:hypothetical protein